MTPEEIWRRKSDEELLAADVRLSEYTELGQRIIVAEMERRGLSNSPTILDAERVSDDITGEECGRCNSVVQEGATYCWQCDAPLRPTTGDRLDVYTASVPGLKRRNVVLMIVFTVVTLGIYLPCWFLGRRHAINSMNSTEKLGVTPFVFAIVLLGIDIMLSMALVAFQAAGEIDAARSIEGMPSVVELLTALLLLVQCYKVRRIFDSHLHYESQRRNVETPKVQRIQSSLGRVWVLPFQIYYLQHIINTRLVEDESAVAA
jgi:Domain of unknown function (DUF4234)